MRKLIYSINVTIDGCCDHTKGIADEHVHNYFTQMMGKAGTLLYGRKTYDLMVPFWPDIAKDQSGSNKAMNDFAMAFDAVDNIVLFSRTLNNVPHSRTRIVNTNLREEVLKLKQQEGKDILLGGVDLASQIMKLDLIDEYRIVVQPVIVGEGRRLFEDVTMPEKLNMKLADTKVLGSSVALRYVK